MGPPRGLAAAGMAPVYRKPRPIERPTLGQPIKSRHAQRPPVRPQKQDSAPVESKDNAPAEPIVLRDRPAPMPLPQGVPIVHLKSVSYGSFIYNRMVDRVEGNVPDGELVAVADKYSRLFGWGFYNSRSAIALRMFSHEAQRPDDSLINRRIAQAVHLRRNVLGLESSTDGYRLIHSEGDGISGLVADRFGNYVVIELFSRAMFERLHRIEDAIVDTGLNVKDFIVRADEHVMEQEGFKLPKVAAGKDRQTVITENNVKFNVQLSRGHKTGFFCDQRENRLALAQFTPGRDVLDVCCYTGGFACYAGVLGRARSITAVDLDENALKDAMDNATLNKVKVDFHHADAFEFLRDAARQGKQWSVVVVDPSKFVPRRDLMEVGLHKYADLNRLAATVVAPGGMLLTCSCSGLVDQPTFVQTIGKAARSAGREMQIMRITGAGPDHPVMAGSPESAYLKAVWARLP